ASTWRSPASSQLLGAGFPVPELSRDRIVACHGKFAVAAMRRLEMSRQPRRQNAPGRGRAMLLHDVGAGLANSGVLIARAAAAPDRADQLAAFDQRKSAGACDQGRIECGHIDSMGRRAWPFR